MNLPTVAIFDGEIWTLPHLQRLSQDSQGQREQDEKRGELHLRIVNTSNSYVNGVRFNGREVGFQAAQIEEVLATR